MQGNRIQQIDFLYFQQYGLLHFIDLQKKLDLHAIY